MPHKPKVLVAMSGGVDSSVAAALLLREGYDVVGCFMRLGSPGETLDALEPFDSAGIACDPSKIRIGHQGCCSINDAADARLVAAELGVPFYVVNFKKDFGRIIDYFVDEYAAGRTPNPCVRCNDWLKFGRLHEYARQIGADFVASGHYARIRRDRGIEGSRDRVEDGLSSIPRSLDPSIPSPPALLRAADATKDQSYVLFGVPRAQLAATLLPIGGLHKSEVRDLARTLGLPTFDKPDSQEICFVPDNDYAGLVERRRPDLAARPPGDVLDPAGNRLAAHRGQHRFTIGQRRGVDAGGATGGERVYVVGKDVVSNTITVGPRIMLEVRACDASEANWLIDGPPAAVPVPVLAKFRYNSPAVPATVAVLPPSPGVPTPSGRTGRFRVVFDEPQHAVAPGQAVVLYDAADPDLVLGGGWITTTQR